MKPLISVIVPVYNGERYLGNCINSILNQTFKDIEVILINDGSSDKSGSICDSFANKDKRVRVIHKNNEGVSSARNLGIDVARGRYIGFVDSDDWIESVMYEILFKNIIEYQADIAITGYIYEETNGNVIKKNMVPPKKVLNQYEALEMLLSPHYFQGYLCNKLFNINLFNSEDKVRLNENIYISEDLLCVCQCILKSYTIVFTEDYFYHYVSIKNSALNNFFNYKMITILDAINQVNILIKNAHPTLEKKVNIISAYSNIYIMRKIVECNLADTILLKRIQNNMKEILKENYKSRFFPRKLKFVIFIITINPYIFAEIYKIYKFIIKKLGKLKCL